MNQVFQIPSWIRYNRNLMTNAKLLYGEMLLHRKDDGEFHLDIGQLCKSYQVTRIAIYNWTLDLEKNGLIKILGGSYYKLPLSEEQKLELRMGDC